jgi:hypothetical protein
MKDRSSYELLALTGGCTEATCIYRGWAVIELRKRGAL